MADYVVGDFCEVKVFTFLDNQLGINVHYGNIMEIAPGGLAEITVANALSTWLGTKVKGCICTNAKFLGVSVRQYRVGEAFPPATVYSKLSAGFGTGGDPPCPKQASGIFRKKTLMGGKKGQGRCYVPFPAVTAVEADGNPTDEYLAAVHDYCARCDLLENVSLDPLLVISFGLMKWRNAASFRGIIECSEVDRFATQMRRGDYGRLNAIPGPLA